MSVGGESFEVDVSGLSRLTANLEKIPGAIRHDLLDAANQAGVKGVQLARIHVPVWEGALRDDIHATPPILSEDGISFRIETDLPYAATMEEGRRPGAKMPPQGALLAWMAAKNIDPSMEFVLRRAISVNGIPGHFFMRFAFEQLSAGILGQLFGEAVDKALAAFLEAA